MKMKKSTTQIKEQKTNAANQVKDQAQTRARTSFENKKKDLNFVDPLIDEVDQFWAVPWRRKGK